MLPICLLTTLFFIDSSFGAEVFRANLSIANEVPAPTITMSGGGPRPIPFGVAYFTLNDAETAMTMWARIRNIDVNGTQTPGDTNDNLTNAHIHASDTASPTTTAGVVWGFHGMPDHDNNPHDEVVTPFTNSVGGIFTSKWDAAEGAGGGLAAQLNRIRTGHAYINFHTVQNGGGEIRAFLEAIPEPSSLLLLAIGGTTLALRRRR
jgi:hypothetical protein